MKMQQYKACQSPTYLEVKETVGVIESTIELDFLTS